MGGHNSRYLRLAVVAAALGAVFAAMNAVPGAATPPAGLVTTPLGRGTDVTPGTIPLQEGTDVVIAQNTFPSGASSGWHSHPGGAIAVVQQGQITLYRAVGNHCDVATYHAHQTFIEPPDAVVFARNEGATTTIVYATFPRVPVGGLSRNDEPDPGTCPGV
jgi:quercetin dioxygenase-like cupin family protein